MEKQFANNIQVRISNDQKTLIVEKDGVPTFISVALIKYMLGVPYTRKDGTFVSAENIRAMKIRNQPKAKTAGASASRPTAVSRA